LSQAGFLLNIILKPTSVKDGLAVVEQGENVEKPSQPALHLHFVGNWAFINFLFRYILIENLGQLLVV
ncbi:MAG: hypothetical protein JXL97_05190, partial [Bacteroidales bacterium]|nr:hypothetical protein [Bacteroidales bacterium]